MYTCQGFPGGSDSNESACNAGDQGLIPGMGRFPWRGEWLLTPIFFPGEFMDRGAKWAKVLVDTKSQTQLSDKARMHVNPQTGKSFLRK